MLLIAFELPAVPVRAVVPTARFVFKVLLVRVTGRCLMLEPVQAAEIRPR